MPRRKKLPPPPLEKTEQAGIKALIRAVGGHFWELSQTRASQQTPGIPDIYAVVPAKAGDTRMAIGLWIEAKRARLGRVSPAQRHFEACCALASQVHLIGELAIVEAWAEREGLLRVLTSGGWEINLRGRTKLPEVEQPLAIKKGRQ